MTSRVKAPDILVVEDNLADAKLTAKLFQQCESLASSAVHVAEDGESALAYLRGDPPWTDRIPPQLMFLDLNLPKLSGLEVLEQVRKDPALSRLAVIVLSSSAAPHDVQRAHELWANAYLRKPVDLFEFRELVTAIDSFWFRLSRYARGQSA